MLVTSILLLLWSNHLLCEFSKPVELDLIGQLEKTAGAPYNKETEPQLDGDLACNMPSIGSSFVEGRCQPTTSQENNVTRSAHTGPMANVLAEGEGQSDSNQRYAVFPPILSQNEFRHSILGGSSSRANVLNTQPQLSLSQTSDFPSHQNLDVWIQDRKNHPLFNQGLKRSAVYPEREQSLMKQSRTQENIIQTLRFQKTEGEKWPVVTRLPNIPASSLNIMQSIQTTGVGSDQAKHVLEGAKGLSSFTTTRNSDVACRARFPRYRSNALELRRPRQHNRRVFIGTMTDYYQFRDFHVERRKQETQYERSKAFYLASNFMGNIELSKLTFSGSRTKIWAELQEKWSEAEQANPSGHPIVISTRAIESRLAAVDYATKTALYSIHIINDLYEPALFESQEELQKTQCEAFQALNQFWKQLDFSELEAREKRVAYIENIDDLVVKTPSRRMTPFQEPFLFQNNPDDKKLKEILGQVGSSSQDEKSCATEKILNNSSSSWAKAMTYSRIAISYLLNTGFPEVAQTLLNLRTLSKQFNTFLGDKIISQASFFGSQVIPSNSQVVFNMEYKLKKLAKH